MLSRIEDEATGRMTLPELFVEIPAERVKQAKATAAILGDEVWSGMPFAGETRSRWRTDNAGTASWPRPGEPQLAVTGMDGYPLPENGGNVLLPYSTAKLSLRLPPTLDAEKARSRVEGGAGERSAL